MYKIKMSDGRGKARKADKKLPEGIRIEDVPEYVSYCDETKHLYWVITNHPWQICVEYKKYILSDGRSKLTIKSVTCDHDTPQEKFDNIMVKYHLLEEKYKLLFGKIPPEIIVKIIKEARVTHNVEKAEHKFAELFAKNKKDKKDEDSFVSETNKVNNTNEIIDIDESPAFETKETEEKDDENEIIDIDEDSIPVSLEINAGAGKEPPKTFNNDIAPPHDSKYKHPKQWKNSVIKTHYLKGILYYYKQFCINENKNAGIYADETKWNTTWNKFVGELDEANADCNDKLDIVIETFSKKLKDVRNGRKKE